MMKRWAGACRAQIGACLRDRRGASAVEFAIVISPFLLTVFFLFQMALSLFWVQSLETSTQAAARAIRTGVVQQAGLSVDQFKQQELCPNLALGLNCSNVTVSVNPVERTWQQARVRGSYAYIDKTRPSLIPAQTDQTAANYCPGGPGDIVFVDAIYRAPVFTPSFWPSSTVTMDNGRRVIVLRATAVVMNEPFQVAGGGIPPC